MPGHPRSPVDHPPTKEHTEAEWESMKGIIQRLYIQDNRKLSETMAILEYKHAFSATRVDRTVQLRKRSPD